MAIFSQTVARMNFLVSFASVVLVGISASTAISLGDNSNKNNNNKTPTGVFGICNKLGTFYIPEPTEAVGDVAQFFTKVQWRVSTGKGPFIFILHIPGWSVFFVAGGNMLYPNTKIYNGPLGFGPPFLSNTKSLRARHIVKGC